MRTSTPRPTKSEGSEAKGLSADSNAWKISSFLQHNVTQDPIKRSGELQERSHCSIINLGERHKSNRPHPD